MKKKQSNTNHETNINKVLKYQEKELDNIKSIDKAMEITENNTGTQLNVAFNYGRRNEIVTAIKKIADDVKNDKLPIDEITEELVSKYLYTNDIPDPDLLIRTSGELRTSNFLPWQLVYSEFYFTDKLWPDFEPDDLDKAIEEYNRRTRKFGAN